MKLCVWELENGPKNHMDEILEFNVIRFILKSDYGVSFKFYRMFYGFFRCYHKSIKSLLIFFGVFTCFAQTDLHNLCFKMLSLISERVLFKLV